MSYEILGSTGLYWTCNQYSWKFYIDVAIAFGWEPESAFFKCDIEGYSEHPRGSYLGNSWQKVTDDDARAIAASLDLAVATINAGSPMSDNHATALKEFVDDGEPFWKDLNLTERQRNGFLKIEAEYLATRVVRTIRTRNGAFDVNIRGTMDLADVVSAGGFTIA